MASVSDSDLTRWSALLRQALRESSQGGDAQAEAFVLALTDALTLVDKVSDEQLTARVNEHAALARAEQLAARYLPSLGADELARRAGADAGWTVAQQLLDQATAPGALNALAGDPFAARGTVIEVASSMDEQVAVSTAPVRVSDAITPMSGPGLVRVAGRGGTVAPAERDRLARVARVTAAVERLPGLPPPDPNDRYSPRALTVLWLTQGDYSPHTTKAYLRELTLWLDWADAHQLDPLNARRADIEAWLSARTVPVTARNPTGKLQRSSHNRALAAVSSWYDYLTSNDLSVRDPTRGVKHRKIVSTAPRGAMTLEALKDFRAWYLERAERTAAAAEDGGEHAHRVAETAARDAALFDLMFFTGLRVSAVTGAEFRDLTSVRGKRVLEFTMKGGGRDQVVLVPTVLATLQRYWELRARRTGVPVARLTGRLLLTTPSTVQHWHHGDAPLHRDLVFRLLRTLAGEAGVPEADHLTPHSTRHTVATVLLAAGVAIRRVQELLGHVDIRTTVNYDAAVHKIETSATGDLERLLNT